MEFRCVFVDICSNTYNTKIGIYSTVGKDHKVREENQVVELEDVTNNEDEYFYDFYKMEKKILRKLIQMIKLLDLCSLVILKKIKMHTKK